MTIMPIPRNLRDRQRRRERRAPSFAAQKSPACRRGRAAPISGRRSCSASRSRSSRRRRRRRAPRRRGSVPSWPAPRPRSARPRRARRVSTVGAETRAMISAVSVSASAAASIGAPEAKGTKPLLSGPKMDGVRNMCSFFSTGFAARSFASPAGFSTSRSARVRLLACGKPRTPCRAPMARGFVHEHRCKRAFR